MKNLNERHNESQKREPEVVPFERQTPAKEHGGSLLPATQMQDLRSRWTSIQSSFVDEPRKSVQEADSLVQSAIKQIEEAFAAERANLEKQWSRGDQVSTEDLRVCLQHYRDFFDRLLTRI
jgi:hypothetical protein